ncbi:MAG: fibronectin type III domain-containing protein [Candidatus Thermoplasmatota archaeon]|nr:fibronectin type III domain-containing protein [Candidatus Thermoplasmatota archaeon]
MTRRAVTVAIAMVMMAIFAGSFLETGPAAGEPTRRLPSAPRNFTATSMNGQIRLGWDTPLDDGDSSRIGFVLLRGPDADNLGVLKSDFGPYDFSWTDTGLTNGQYYSYGVKAINEEGVGEMSPVLTLKPVGKATAPLNITYQYYYRRVDIQWRSPADDGGDPISGYYVLRGPNQDTKELAIKLGNVLQYSDIYVTNGVAYYYRIMAFTSYMNGTVSDYFQVTPRGVPGAPGEFNVVPMDRKVYINWTYPGDDGGASIMGYNIYRGFTQNTMEFLHYVSSRTEYTDNNITNGQYYHYSASAVNSEGEGALTDIIKVLPIGVPDSPLNLTVEPGDTYARLSWRTPEDDGGSELLGYYVFRTTKGAPMTQIDDVGLDLSYTDENLTNGDFYYYQVKAYNDQGIGYPSETVGVKPDFSPAPPENFRLTELDGYLKLMWALPSLVVDYPVFEFRLYRGLSGDDLELHANLTLTDSMYEDDDVEIGVQYFYALTAVSKIGEGDPTKVISGIPFTKPAHVQDLEAVSSNKRVGLSWDPPEFLGGRDIINYKIFRGENTDTMSAIEIVSGSTTHYNDTNVVNGVTYYYSVMAMNEKAEGDLCPPVDAEPLGPPDPPRNLVLSVLEDSILLEWEQPRSNGGRTLTGYIIMRGPSQLNLTDYTDVGFVQNFTDTDIEKGITYYYAIKGVNEIGEGKQSNTAYGKIQETVINGEEKDSTLLYVVGGAVFLIVLAILIIVVVVLSKRKQTGEEEAPEFEESEKEREYRLIMERRQQMKEYTDVALTTDEAHAHDHAEHKLSYEDLYGSVPNLEEIEQPAPFGPVQTETSDQNAAQSASEGTTSQPPSGEGSDQGNEGPKVEEKDQITPQASG